MSDETPSDPGYKSLRSKPKLCIVGCSDTKQQTPWELANEYEFWGVNNLYLTVADKPWTRWFEIHQITHKDGKWLRRGKPEFRGQTIEKYLEGLASLKCPVYMQASNPIVPNAIPYPLQEIVQKYGTYFTNTISYEIALGLFEGFEEIRILGVDMAVDTEWYHQRPSCEFFLGLAQGMGRKIVLPEACDLLKTRFLYGFQEQQALPFEEKLAHVRKTILTKREQCMQEKLFKQKQEEQYTGALVTLDELYKVWKNVTGA